MVDVESLPDGTDSANTLTTALQSDLGGSVTSLTWAADKPVGVQVSPQTRSQVSKSKGKDVGDLKDDKDTVATQKSAQTVDSRGEDDAYFQDSMTEMGKKRNKTIKIKLSEVKLTDPRVPKELKKMKQHLHSGDCIISELDPQ